MNTASTIVGLILAVIGIIITIRYKSSIKLTYITNNWFPILNTIADNLDDISITYKGENISQNIYFFSISFINSGNKDIDELIIHKPLILELPKSYKFLNSKVISNSENLEVESKSYDNKLEMNWSLFKTGEYYRINNLVEFNYDSEIKPQKNPPKFKFEHRISNLKYINPYEITFQQNKVPTFLLVSVFVLWGVILINNTFKSFGKPNSSIQYLYEFNGDEIQANLELNNDNTVSIIKAGKEIKKVKDSQLIECKLVPTVVYTQKSFDDKIVIYFRIMLGGLLFLFGIYTLAKYFMEKNLLENKNL